MTEREANVRSMIERKSLLPRLIYLSIQSASTSLKENLEINGSASDPKISSELKILLERYAKMLGYSFTDAIEVVLGVSGGQKSFEVLLHHQSHFTLIWLLFGTCEGLLEINLGRVKPMYVHKANLWARLWE